MPFELDHVFILAEAGAPEADLLARHGLVEGEPNRHPGQGTACRRFFFANFMLELLWVCEEEEERTEPANGLHLAGRSRWRENGASPFGVCLRPGGEPGSEKPFPGWSYRPPYLPEGLDILIGNGSDRIDEPLLFYLSFARRQGDVSQRPDLREVAAVRVYSKNSRPPFEEVSRLEWVDSPEPLLELVFRSGGAVTDLRPDVPLVLRR